MSRNSLLARVRQVASPRKTAKSRLERVQKVNKVSKSLFGPVIKSEFKRFAQMEMTKYQLQASDKWGFDFVREAPIAYPNSQFKWESSKLSEIPKFYHHIAHPARLAPRSSGAASFYPLFGGCENICPITQSISATSMIAQNPSVVNKRKIGVASSSASTSFEPSAACSHQRKITDYLKVRKRRMSTTSAVCLKKARAEF